MKMNDLDNLVDLAQRVEVDHVPEHLKIREAASKGHLKIGNGNVAELGGLPIKYMNHLMTTKNFHPDLIGKVTTPAATHRARPITLDA
jgi:hypothetical protein